MFKKSSGNGASQDSAADLAIPATDRIETTPKAARPAPPAPSPAARDERPRLIVGPNIKLKGAEITDCDTLVVEGRVEASMDSRVIQIAEGGVFKGTVCIDRAEVRGTFEGEMTVRDRLVVHGTGRISGKVRYGRMAIEEGGEITGDVAALPPNERKNESVVVQPAAASEPAQAPEPELAGEPEGIVPVRPKREAFVHPARTVPPNGAHRPESRE